MKHEPHTHDSLLPKKSHTQTSFFRIFGYFIAVATTHTHGHKVEVDACFGRKWSKVLLAKLCFCQFAHVKTGWTGKLSPFYPIRCERYSISSASFHCVWLHSEKKDQSFEHVALRKCIRHVGKVMLTRQARPNDREERNKWKKSGVAQKWRKKQRCENSQKCNSMLLHECIAIFVYLQFNHENAIMREIHTVSCSRRAFFMSKIDSSWKLFDTQFTAHFQWLSKHTIFNEIQAMATDWKKKSTDAEREDGARRARDR